MVAQSLMGRVEIAPVWQAPAKEPDFFAQAGSL